MPSTQPIDRFARRRFWLRRLAIQRWRWRLSRVQLGSQTLLNGSGDRARTILSLARAAMIPGLVGGGIWAGVEAASWWLRRHGPDPLSWLGERVIAEPYDGLISAGISATATFLGLYWATVGVVASTVYASVPGDIRNLFVLERSGTVFVRAALYALILGLLQFGFATATGRHPTSAGVIVFTGLCGVSALWLVILGSRLFNFFDSSTLASALPQRFERAIRQAGARSLLPRNAADSTAHTEASRVLNLLSGLATLSATRPSRSNTGRYRIALYVLSTVMVNTSLSRKVASTSAWWQKVSEYRNFFAVDHLRLNSALATSTGVPPALVTDYQWVERHAAEILSDLLGAMQTPAERLRAVKLLNQIAVCSRTMAQGNHVAEALALRPPLVAQVTRFNAGTTPEEFSIALAEAEPMVVQLTDLWLGFVDRCSTSSNRDLAADFTAALGSVNALYGSGLPREAITLAEDLISKRASEAVIAGSHVTPMWWLHHFLARSVATYVATSAEQILTEAQGTLRLIAVLTERGENQRATIALFAATELSHKIGVHAGTVQGHLEQLDTFRRTTVGNGQWPTRPPIAEHAETFRASVMVALAEQLPALREETHDSSRPDLYGQAYQVVSEAAWDYLLEDRRDTAKALFLGLLGEFDSARLRASADFIARDPQLRFELTAEPVITVMDVSGVAYLMQELNGDGIWNDVVAAWDDLLPKGGPLLLRQLLAAGEAQEGLTRGPGQLIRIGRAIRLRQLLHERGIGDDDGYRSMGPRRTDPAFSAPLQIFADSYNFHDRPWQYFLVEYLAAKLTADQTLPREGVELAEQLRRSRKKATPTAPQKDA